MIPDVSAKIFPVSRGFEAVLKDEAVLKSCLPSTLVSRKKTALLARSPGSAKVSGFETMQGGEGGFSSNWSKPDPRPGCKKCGYGGHLTFQCRNFVQV